jgi:hypothetical protein
MAKCRVCGGYASEGKVMCPWDQIRHGELVKGKWVVDATGATADFMGAITVKDSGGQIEFFGLNGDYYNSENEQGEN